MFICIERSIRFNNKSTPKLSHHLNLFLAAEKKMLNNLDLANIVFNNIFFRKTNMKSCNRKRCAKAISTLVSLMA